MCFQYNPIYDEYEHTNDIKEHYTDLAVNLFIFPKHIVNIANVMCDQSNPKAENDRVVYEEDNQAIAKGSIPYHPFAEGLIITLYFVMMKFLPPFA